MEKIVKIPITFHDIVNVLMWDDEFNKDNVTSRVPCGKKNLLLVSPSIYIIQYKKYADKSQYALAVYYKESLPNTEATLKELQDFYLGQIKSLKKSLKNNPISASLDLSAFINPTKITVGVMPCPRF